MELIIDLIDFFGINALEEGATYVDFLMWFSEVLLAVGLIVIIFAFFFKACKDMLTVTTN